MRALPFTRTHTSVPSTRALSRRSSAYAARPVGDRRHADACKPGGALSRGPARVVLLLKRESVGRLFCSVIRTQQHDGASPKPSGVVQFACVRAVDLGEIGSCSAA